MLCAESSCRAKASGQTSHPACVYPPFALSAQHREALHRPGVAFFFRCVWFVCLRGKLVFASLFGAQEKEVQGSGGMAPKSRPRSKSKLKKGPPPPPPVILYATNKEDFEAAVLQYKGACLVAVVTPFCSRCTRTVMPYLEKLNSERPSLLSALNIVVINASDESVELCRSLELVAVPTFFAYSYGKQLTGFLGDNVEKALLLAKLAAQQAEEDAKEAMKEEAAAVAAEAGTAPVAAPGTAER
ncbi:uncharacterized protein Tco025E_08528 [Trypanosoma conorhini]|uniref:Thioredoxin domain-containing protein n=1 Tax=Trypanosoma conorhini TaxID=83891 RepID=A0A3R7M968_9TRYP|nr:uncharacterized protein Tco025E_08528 [Trypanosoma conorhini]RNF01681.1 hypothetical protein Tco025E_08528 [Trypanosoma conorhini]